MKWFGRMFGKVGESHAPQEGELPAELLAALDTHSYASVSPAIRAWCADRKVSANPKFLSAEARKRGWDGPDLEKLEIFVEYYSGDAVRAFERARPYTTGELFDPDLFLISMAALYQNNQFEDAYRFVKSADPHEDILSGRGDYWIMRALICWAANDMEALKEAADRMCALSPTDVTVLENACGMYLELGDVAAVDAIRKTLSERRERPGYAYAINTLALGDYEEGFRQMEARYEMEEAHRYINRALLDLPRWTGEDLTGKVLLISAEQGLGDTIQMSRYLPQLHRLGARKVVMETQPETVALLQSNFPDIEFLVREYAKLPPVTFDLWVGAMSLPHLLSAAPADIPDRPGYLRVPSENSEYWRTRVGELAAGSRPRVGLAWSGQALHRSDRRRSIPYPRMMDAIRDKDVNFFALQMNVPSPHPANLIDVSEELLTLCDTAGLIQQMDLVISVDTSVVHVAGAIGKETWLLLPYRYEWRWGLEGESNRWYDSVKVLRQARHGDWSSLLDEVFDRRLVERWSTQGER